MKTVVDQAARWEERGQAGGDGAEGEEDAIGQKGGDVMGEDGAGDGEERRGGGGG